MTLSVSHTFVCGIADDAASAAAGEVLPSHWNATHTLTGTASAAQLDLTMSPTWTGLHAFNGGWTSTIAQPTLSTYFESFYGATQGANPSFKVGTWNKISWTGSMTNGATALMGQSWVTTTAGLSGNNGEVGGVYGGALNQVSGAAPYGVFGCIYNDTNAVTPGGEGVLAAVRGDLANTNVRGIRASSEVASGQHPEAGVSIGDSGNSNAFEHGVMVISASLSGFTVGTEEASTDAGAVTPTRPFSFYGSPGTLTWFVDSSGRTTTNAVYGGIATNSSLTLQGTSNVAPSGDKVQIVTGSSAVATFLNGGATGFGDTNPQGRVVVSNNAASGLTATGTLNVIGPDSAAAAQINYAYGGLPRIDFKRADGTGASPSNVATNDIVGQIGVSPYVNGAFTAGSAAQIQFKYVDSSPNTGTQINFNTTPVGSTTFATAVQILASGGVAIGSATTTDPGAGGLALHPGSSITPAANGDLVFQATSNTSLTFKYKGSDGTVRSASLTLA